MNTRLSWIIVAVMIALAVIGSAWVYPSLPDQVPTHWNIEGKVDAYGSKTWAVWLMPGIMVGMALLFWALPALSPKPFQLDSFRRTYQFIVVLVVGLMGVLHAVIMLQTMYRNFDLGRVLLGVIFVFFALMGNVMGKVRRNFYVGIRVPWTLASDRVWNDTHRLAARLWVAAGLIGCALLWLPKPWFLASFGPLLVAVVVPIVYSWMHYKRLEREGQLETQVANAN